MLNTQQIELLKALYSTLDERQRIWLAGYVQGQVGEVFAPPSADTHQPAHAKTRVAIYYATETGNSKALALNLMKALKGAGFKASNTAMNRLKPSDIKADQPAIFLASTHGEGDPPEAAVKFFDALAAEKDGALDGLSYAVLGLGDSSYEIFCGAATKLDENLQRLGGKPFQDIALFDVDFASHTPGWIKSTADALGAKFGGGATSVSSSPVDAVKDFFANMGGGEDTVRTGAGYTRLEPVTGTVKEIINLNDTGSDKQTYHVEIAYEENITYTPGDAAGIILPPGPDGKELTPRLYSIASSPSLHEGELHLTVALATHVNEDGSTGHGICSHYLAQLQPGDEVQFYISQNQLFNLPEDDRDIIMIGPGTGIAPFRSFVAERSERGADGRNWLFYGDRHAHCDFLYQAEWQEHIATDTLQRFDAAFSRDQEEKIYVQDKLHANADELLQWLDNGASIYVCGTKDPMSRDVETALLDIIAQGRGITPDQAADVLADLEEAGRYAKDVY